MQLISVLSLLLVIVQLVMQGQAFRFARSTAIQQLKLQGPTATTTQFRLFQSTTPTSASPSTVVGRCTQKISDALNPTKIIVTANGDDPNGDHIQILCVSTEFEGKNSVQRQRLVYKVCLIFILSNLMQITLSFILLLGFIISSIARDVVVSFFSHCCFFRQYGMK